MFKNQRKNKSISLNESIKSNQNNEDFKKYRCRCCKDKKYHDYNRQNRLKRESISLKRLYKTSQQVYKTNPFGDKINLVNLQLINSQQNYQIKGNQYLNNKQQLQKIVQSPVSYVKSIQKDKQLSQKHQKIDMNSYCKSLFSNSSNKKKVKSNQNQPQKIKIKINQQVFYTQFYSSQQMKLALGQIKLIIQKSQKN